MTTQENNSSIKSSRKASYDQKSNKNKLTEEEPQGVFIFLLLIIGFIGLISAIYIIAG